MTENINNITNTLTITKGSKENFISPQYLDENLLIKTGIQHGGISVLKPGYRVTRSYCTDHILIYCTSGNAEVTRPDGTHAFSKGDLVLIPGNASQNYGSKNNFSMMWLHLQPNHKRLAFIFKIGFKIWPAYNNQLESLFRFIYNETINPKDINPKIVHAWSELMLTWLEREFISNDSQTTIRHRRRLDDLWLIVSDDLAYPWTISNLASKIHLSPAHLHSLMQELYNTTPMGMVTKLRLNKVHLLLQNTDLKLGSIANMVGYSSPFSLSRLFKRHYGFPPRDLRKQ
jgi:AraC-like DNA-binding protein